MLFTKPLRIKGESLVKSSDKKKLRIELEKQWPLLTRDVTNELIPQKSELHVVKVLAGQASIVYVYFLSQQPILFEYQDAYYPTVYTAWKYIDHMTAVQTWLPTLSKIMNGGDLMTHSVAVHTENATAVYPHITPGKACCISTLEHRGAVAVGSANVSGDTMLLTGVRCKAVTPLHHYGDQLWAIGCKELPPWVAERSPPTLQRTMSKSTATMAVGPINSLILEDDADSDRSAGVDSDPEYEEITIPHVLNNMDDDERLYKCFLYVLKEKITLPMSVAKFYEQMQNCCPAGVVLDIQRTKYRKLVEFFHEMEKKDIIMLGDVNKSTCCIQEVNRSHKELRNFIPWSAEEAAPCNADRRIEIAEDLPEITELHVVNQSTLQFFQSLGLEKGDKLTYVQVETFLHDYVKDKALQHANKLYARVDSALSTVLPPNLEGEYVKKADILDRFIKAMGTLYQLDYSSGAVLCRELPSIQIALDHKHFDKKACTVVSYLDRYGIDVKTFAKNVRSVTTCSTAITVQHNGPQVIAHGNQVSFIYRLLREKYRIAERYIVTPQWVE